MIKKLADFHRKIGLDHFYVGFSAEQIKDLRSLARLPFCKFNRIKSGSAMWQGVYWTAANGHYFEMVESSADHPYRAGIAFSANAIQYFDVRSLPSLLPEADFEVTRKKFGKAKWFDSIKVRGSEGGMIFPWLMHYHFCPVDETSPQPNVPSFIERFTELELRVPENFLQGFDKSAFWAPIDLTGTPGRRVLTMKSKDRSEFRIIAREVRNFSTVEFVSLKGQAAAYSGKLPSMKYFKLERIGKILILRRR